MVIIKSDLIEKAVYNLCVKANTQYDSYLYGLLLERFHCLDNEEEKFKYANILNNIRIASELSRPLCQDTGQVVIFLKLGNSVQVEGDVISVAINNAIEKAYKENFYRKSIVNNAVFNRCNTKTNTPAVIYTEIVEGCEISIDLMIKGAGSENYGDICMFKPSSSKKEIFEFVKNTVVSAGEKSCPPLVLGVGIGGTMDYAAILSKKAFFHNSSELEAVFEKELKDYISSFTDIVLDVKVCTTSTHIASLPVAVTINCHSCRHSSCSIGTLGIKYEENTLEYEEISMPEIDFCNVSLSDISAIHSLKSGQYVYLTGEVYTARDAAHKLIKEYYDANHSFPFDIKNKVIFYAGPCPAAPEEVIGSIGPTTAARMDAFCDFMHSNGLLATIGKGERSEDATKAIAKHNAKYFVAQGGVACLLAKCVKKSEVIAFDELGTEAVRKLYVEKFPVKVVI